MALTKTVELKILASAGDAQAKLDEADARAKELDGKTIKMRFRVDESDARGQIEAIRARAKLLGYDDVNVKVRVTGTGRAIADLEAVKHEMDSVDRRSLEGGLLSRLIGGAGGGISGQMPLPFLGSAGLPAIAAAIPAIGAIGTELVGVISGFAAAGTGAGAFALLAAPAVKHVETAYQGLNKAQAAYHAAQAKEAADPTKANKNAVAAAALNLKLAQESISKLPGPEQAAIKGVSGLVTEFGKMSRAFEPQAFKVFASGLKVAGELLPHVTPFANTFATGLGKLFGQLGKFTQSKGFNDWLKQFHSLEGPAIGAIGHGIGQVANSFGKLMTIMSGRDVAHAINIAFGAVSGTINVVAGGLHRFMQNWDGMSRAAVKAAHGVASAFDSVRHGFAGVGHDIAHDFDSVRHAYAEVGHGIASGFDSARHGIAAVADGIVSAFTGIPGKIKGIFSGAAGWLASAGSSMIGGLVHGVESGVGSISGVISGIGSKIKGVFSGAAGWLISAGSSMIGGLAHGLESGWGAVSGWLGGLGSRIKGVFSGAAGWLVSAGRNIVEGLIHGIESMIGTAVGVVRGLGSAIAHGFSAVMGIFSPSRVMHSLGQKTVDGLILALQGGKAAVQAASAAIGSAVIKPFSDATIAAASKKLIAGMPSQMVSFLKMDTAKLQSLAGQRKVLEAEIQQSEQVAQAAIQANTVMTAAGAGPDPNAQPVSTQQVVSGMQYQLSQLKQFASQVRQLKKDGLNATSLSQIIQAGAGPGSQVAQALLDGGKQAVSQINGLQKQLKAQAAALGDEAAPAMYQAGVQAGQGLAQGLKSQLGAVAQAIQQLVQEMVSEAKKDLKSHSPSLVFAEIGDSIPSGTAAGITRSAHLAIAASSRLAGAVVQPWARPGGGTGGGGDVHVHFHGVVGDPQAVARQIHGLMRDYKRKGGNAALGLG